MSLQNAEVSRRKDSRRKPVPGFSSPRRSRQRTLIFDDAGRGAAVGQLGRSDSAPALRRTAARRDGLSPCRDHLLRGLSYGLPYELPTKTIPVSATNGHLPRDSPVKMIAAQLSSPVPAAAPSAAAASDTSVAHSRPVRAASAGAAANMALLAALDAEEPRGVGPIDKALAAATTPALKHVLRGGAGKCRIIGTPQTTTRLEMPVIPCKWDFRTVSALALCCCSACQETLPMCT